MVPKFPDIRNKKTNFLKKHDIYLPDNGFLHIFVNNYQLITTGYHHGIGSDRQYNISHSLKTSDRYICHYRRNALGSYKTRTMKIRDKRFHIYFKKMQICAGIIFIPPCILLFLVLPVLEAFYLSFCFISQISICFWVCSIITWRLAKSDNWSQLAIRQIIVFFLIMIPFLPETSTSVSNLFWSIFLSILKSFLITIHMIPVVLVGYCLYRHTQRKQTSHTITTLSEDPGDHIQSTEQTPPE